MSHSDVKTRVGVVGGAGYTGGELLRILLFHPNVEIAAVMSRSHAGQSLGQVHADLQGETLLEFSEGLPAALDVVFLCLGQGESKAFLESTKLPAAVRIIDLSTDYRPKQASAGDAVGKYQDKPFIYGLPEWKRLHIAQATHIANPGCFATAIQLALLPLAASGLLPQELHISGITGATGAGQKPTETNHFNWRYGNASVYKALTHQHLAEVGSTLLEGGWVGELNFIPYRGPFPRGIIVTVYGEIGLAEQTAHLLYDSYYQSHPFVNVLPLGQEAHLKRVLGTNRAVLQVQVVEGKLVVVSAIDNLLKGASGQAVQNLNLMMGWPETLGLALKATAF